MNLVGLLRRRAQDRPRHGFTFLADGENESARLSYAELDRRARGFAASLAESLSPGERALLLYPPGLDLIAAFFGCVYAGVIAVPAYPPRSNDRSLARLRAIVRDAEPAAVLTTSVIAAGADGARGLGSRVGDLARLRWLLTDSFVFPEGLSGPADGEGVVREPAPDEVAFLQYTSGSTAAPKGVMVSHANLLHNERMIGLAFAQDESAVVVGWLPLFHDMGLIGNVLQPLYAGARCVLMPPVAFLQKPWRWLAALSRYQGTTSGGPNFGYELCVRRIGEAERAGLDLRSWRVAFNGAEPVRESTLARFAEAFAPCGFRREAFYPCYGLAEATLFVTGGAVGSAPRLAAVEAAALERHEARLVEADAPGARRLVGCGQAWLDQRVAVVDPETGRERPPGRVGEIWVQGPSVARGYWRRPEETASTFGAALAGGDGRFLRTGDLGFVLAGELFVTGRLKDLIILRGRNHYPQDIELTVVGSHADLRPEGCAAFALEADGEERLVVVAEVERRGTAEGSSGRRSAEVAAAIRCAVAEEHEAQVHEVVLLRSGTIPKTSSGKIQRHVCRAEYLSGGLEVVGRSGLDRTDPTDPAALATLAAPVESELALSRDSLLTLEPGERAAALEAWLRHRAAGLLRTSVSRIEPGLPLTALGLDSLAAVELRQAVEQELGADVPLVGLLEGATVAGIAAGVLADLATGGPGAPGLEPGEPVADFPFSFPLSRGQQALWFLQRLAPGSAAYHITAAVRVKGDLDVPALHRAFQALADRHPVLRTTFHVGEGGEPFQRVHGRLEVGFAVADATGLGEGALATRLAAFAHAPFDLETGPLLRAAVFALGETGHALVLAVHHLVADFTSLAVAVGELAWLYELEDCLPPPPVSYADYVRWQAGRLAGPEGERLWAYWREALAGPPPDLDLVADRPRPPVQTDRGASVALALGPELTARVSELARSSGATLFTTLLAAFQALLHRYTGQEDFAVGAPVAGRSAPELADLVGYFVNPVVLRAPLAAGGADPTFVAFLGRVRRVALEALAHQELPFVLLAERLQPNRDPSRSPLFQAMLVLQTARRPGQEALAPFALGESGAEIALGPLALTSLALPERPAQFDLTLAAAEGRDGLAVSLQFNADLFDMATAGRMLGHFRTFLAGAAGGPDRTLYDLPLLTAAERDQLLVEWNATIAAYPRDRLLHELFEEQADRTPDRVALEAGLLAVTYWELERRANQLAHHLARLGIAPETPVGVHLERSADVAVGVLGILKSGAEYLPLDPAYPPERVASTLADAGAPLVLTLESLEPSLQGPILAGCRRLRLDADWPAVARERESRPACRADAESASYLIYTSGSTGLPKGVQVRHRGVVNFLSSMARRPGLGAGDVLAAVTTLAFDIAGLELYLPWSVGARVVLVSREDAADGTRLLALLQRTGTTAMQATPSTWRLLLAADWEGDPPITVLCGGEALPRDLAEALLARAPSVWNLYGPTETTIWSAEHQVFPGAAAPVAPLGRPIANTGIFILDAALRPVPAGVPGELLIGGDGLARGYFRRPALTAERFVPDGVSGSAGARLYRTGDLGRWRADGTLEFLGRLDHQVKIRGHRVELGEVEAALAAHPAVEQAVVVACRDPAAGQRLVGYVVGRHPPAPSLASPPSSPGEGEVPSSDLRRFLAERLPDAFVPSLFVTLPVLPLTPNGKVDRKALPAPESVRRQGLREAPRSERERAVAAVWREVLSIPEVGLYDNFFDLGGHSLLMAQVQDRLRRDLGFELSLVDLLRHPTVAALAARLSPSPGVEPEARPVPAGDAPRGAAGTRAVDVAVVGMAVRFPGASSVEVFWRNLRDGVESVRRLADEELLAAGVDAGTMRDPAYVRLRPVLDGIELFDAAFFGYSPLEAAVLDPQHRIFLECAWEALEDAGCDPRRYAGRIGVFAGSGLNTYLRHNLASNPELLDMVGDFQAMVSNDKDYIPTRVSYKLDLKGPSVAVQTACSTSLVALHLACRSLVDGECEAALAGGVTIRVPQAVGYLYQEGRIESPDGHCRAFDAEAQGTVVGSGAGAVLLKPLARALADGDHVYAVIKGTAINNDGSLKVGYTAPSAEGQAAVIVRALDQAGVPPESIAYVEAHGTGTPLGDPVEVAALTEALGRDRVLPCAIGSVKTNIGHLDAASGIAGFIKTALALAHHQIPPSLHFARPSPRIDWAGGRIRVNERLTDWPEAAAPRRAGVSSFGIGGTNAHVVVEEAPPLPATSVARPWMLLPISARTLSALEQATRALAGHLTDHPDLDLADVAFTLQTGRRQLEQRRVVVCDSPQGAASSLASLDPQRVWSGTVEAGDRPVVFLFPGQGTGYVGMGRQLYESEPAFRDAIDRCAELARPLLAPEGSPDLRRLLYPGPHETGAAERALERISLGQPALFAVEHALSRLWMEWGLRPRAMIGHSVGEFMAAHLAGVFSFEEALRLVIERSRLMQSLPPGAMLSVPLPEEEVLPRLGSSLSLAAVNAPDQCLVAGPEEAVMALQAQLASCGLDCRRLRVGVAGHSWMNRPLEVPFAAAVAESRPQPPRLPYITNLTGTWVTAEQATDPGHWARHLSHTVRFAAGLEELCRDPDAILLEVGPGRSLSNLVRQVRGGISGRTVLLSLRHPSDPQPDRRFLLGTLGRLWLAGAAVDWERFSAPERRRRVALPTYPFERQRCWIEPRDTQFSPSSLQRRKDPDAWFYLPSWRRSAPPVAAPEAGPEPAPWLVLAGDSSLSRRVARHLHGLGHTVIVVEPGVRFVRTGEGEYRISPGEPSDYQRLLDDLATRGPLPCTFLHLWTLSEGGPAPSGPAAWDRLQEAGFYGLLGLAQALAHRMGSDPACTVRILAVTSGAQEVTGEEALQPEAATLLGPAVVIPQEHPEISCRVLDVVCPEPGSPAEARLVAWIVAEAGAAAADPVVAWRGGYRWVRELAPLGPDRSAASSLELRRGGTYLITGGLGRIGSIVAGYLVREAEARLVLCGRSWLPPEEEWTRYLAGRNGGEDDPIAARLRRLIALRESGGEILAVSADVADPAALAAAVAKGRQRFGRIDGVFHAAGVVGHDAAVSIEAAGRRECEPQLRPKVLGLTALERAFAGGEPDFFLLFSSIATLLGGLGYGAYAAANSYMDLFAQRKAREGGALWVSVDWEAWRFGEWGEGAGPGALLHELAITPEEGVEVLQRLFSTVPALPQVVVSTADPRARLARWSEREATAGAAMPRSLGTAGTLAGPRGEPLLAHARPHLQVGYLAPRNATEEQVADVWRELLGIEQIGVHDDFFELGGHSVLATQLVARLRRTLRVELPLERFFASPTVAGVAEHVSRQGRAEDKAQRLEEILREIEAMGEGELPDGPLDGPEAPR